MSRISKEAFISELKKSPDIYEEFTTISYQMKCDVYDYFRNKPDTLSCIEIGCYKGITTRILSHMFDKVIAVDFNTDFLYEASQNNIDRPNVQFINVDLMDMDQIESELLPYKGEYEVALIDGNHSYEACKRDTETALLLGCKYLIFDDVGLYDGVSKAISEKIDALNSEIEEVVVVGIDWSTYVFPELSLDMVPFYMGGPLMEVGFITSAKWKLKDTNDIKINGSPERPFNEKMDIHISALHGRNRQLVNGVFQVILDNNDSVVNQIDSNFIQPNPMMSINTANRDNAKDKATNRFTPIPMHRVGGISPLFARDPNKSTSNRKEGMIIKLK